MPVRLLRPYNGQALNTIYAKGYTSSWAPGVEDTLRAMGSADDFVENAIDYPAFQQYRQGQQQIATGEASALGTLGVYPNSNPQRLKSVPLTQPTPNVAGGWGSAGTATLTSDPTMMRVPGRATTKVVYSNNQYPNLRAATPVTTINGRFVLSFFIPLTMASGLSMSFFYSSDTPSADPPTATATNYRRFTIQPAQLQYGAWNDIVFDVNAGSIVPGLNGTAQTWTAGGTPITTQVGQVQVNLNFPDATANNVIWFDVVQMLGGAAKPAMLITFDGVWQATGSQIGTLGHLNILQSLGLVASQNVDGNEIVPNKAILDQVYAAGWDISQQGLNHTNYVTAYNTTPNTNLITSDWQIADGLLVAAGYKRGRDVFAPPNAATNAPLRAALYGLGVRFCRGGSAPIRTAISTEGDPNSINPGLLPISVHWETDSTANAINAATMKTWTQDAILHKDVTTTLTHALVTGTTDSSGLQTGSADFAAWATDLAVQQSNGLIEVLTVSQYLQQRLVPFGLSRVLT